MKSYEELLQDLAATQAKLEEERKTIALQLQKEREEMNLLAQMERQAQLEAYKVKVEEHERRKRAEEEAAEARKQQEQAARIAADQNSARANAEYQAYHAKLEELEKAIANAEFSEEKHKKAIEDAKAYRPPVAEFLEEGINVEHPVPPDNAGNAVEGTDGIQESPLMSSHLKQILRQAQRS